MARPMLLVQEDIISDIWAKANDGVPLEALIRQYELPITSPTLKKLLGHVTALENADGKEELTEVYDLIYASLFPEWLIANEDKPVVQQPEKVWYYDGLFPVGKWCKHA